MYRVLLDHPDRPSTDLSTLRRALDAMAPMPGATLRECLEVFGCGFHLLFGQTEKSPTTTIFRPEHQLSHNGAAGTPTANVHVAIMADDGTLLPQDETGEIVYRGPQTTTAHLKDEKATDEAFRHGWFHSGDLGHFDTGHRGRRRETGGADRRAGRHRRGQGRDRPLQGTEVGHRRHRTAAHLDGQDPEEPRPRHLPAPLLAVTRPVAGQ